MKLWNINETDINQLYNNKIVTIKANSIEDYNDELAVFLLSKREIRGLGLVQFKDNDDKTDRYMQARKQQYDWAIEKWTDYQRHCEERESQKLQALAPHKEILPYKKTIDIYEAWEKDGFPMQGFDVPKDKEAKTVYACPVCNKEFDVKVAYFGHMRSHQKENVNVDTSSVKDAGKGKG